jgi:hypothetical protein
MSNIMTAAVSALQSRVYDQIATSLMKSSAQAQQAVADMLMQNAQRGAELSQQTAASSTGRIDIYA